MFWTIAGVVLAIVLIGAWVWDRKHSMDRSYRDANGADQARADASVTQLGQWNGY
ncbi:hypothetical protein ACOCJ4_04320 [Knoellia sp. CPCC 206435]|uniref:hypothetical protein n=1 Tax=Knoellia terrae TaxID=3404797 RepID=UPI003B42F179